MSIWGARNGLVALALLVLIYAQGSRVVLAEGTVRMRLLGGRLIVVPVYLNDQGPFDFLLDTGTTSTILTPELAARLGLRPVDRVTLITVGGARDVPRTRLHKLAMGGAALADVEALVSGLEQVRKLDPRVRGVLGQNFFERFNYTLDYDSRTVEFRGAGGAPPSGERIPFVVNEGRLIVGASSGANAPRALRLVLDAAATDLVIFDDLGGSLALSFPVRSAALLLTEAGSSEARLARLGLLRVGDSRLKDVPVALLPGPTGRGARAEDGLLPTNLFSAIYFDHGDRYVIFNPKPAPGLRGRR
jgi:predicted aspartyl protease